MASNIVLIPIDKTPFSEKILPTVRRFFQPAENQIILLHIADIPRHGTGAQADLWQKNLSHEMVAESYSQTAVVQAQHPIYDTQIEASVMANLKAQFAHLEKIFRKNGYIVSTEIQFGEPSEGIINYIKREKVDIVALTTHSHAGLSRLLLGSVAEQILRNVSIPVLLLRPKGL